MHASQARSRILGATNLQVPARRPFLSQSGFHTDSIFGQVRNTTVQVWTVGEGFGIGSEFSQTCGAANIFEIMRSFFVGSKEQATTLVAPHWGETRGIFRTLA